MTGPRTRLRAGLLSGLLAVLGLAAPGLTPAQAAGCDPDQVSVVIDYGQYGGVDTSCAGSFGTGTAALASAGFSVTAVTGQPFVCRIDGIPASDPCVRIPPTTAYWSYWHSSGGSWSYSTVGAYTSHPIAGSAEGWAFGAGTPPGVAPPSPVTPAPSSVVPPPLSSSPPPPRSTGPAVSTASPPPPATTQNVPVPPQNSTVLPPSSAVPPLNSTAAASESATGSAATPESAATTTSAVVAAAPVPAAAATSSGPAWNLLLAALVVLALGAGAWWQVRQRR